MAILDLTIDLPQSAYHITDKPNAPQRIADQRAALFSALMLFLALAGIAAIWAVNVIESSLEWLMIDVRHLMTIVIATTIGLLMGKMRTVAYVA